MAKKRRTLGCLFYIALVLLVLVVFLFNRSRVQEVLEKTGFTRLFEKQSDQPAEVLVEPLKSDEQEEESPPPPSSEAEPDEIVITVEKEPATKPVTEKQKEVQTKIRQSRLFFISVTTEGQITMKGVIRGVEYTDAPLTATLEALLQGPTTVEVNQGLISLISPQTRINTVYIKGNTAYVDFNEAIRFNSLGREGMIAELKQVVYTATEFPTVKSVQILVDGEISRYLGPEGVAIDKPLGRDSF
ncbi:MAG: GerMN domain-containing protein [Spirochaetaceae bacterium]|nr:MAG: GerMN domain-containing protein [Spirochaetaceae bacterium]